MKDWDQHLSQEIVVKTSREPKLDQCKPVPQFIHQEFVRRHQSRSFRDGKSQERG